MSGRLKANDAVHWFISELTSSIVAKSGRPTDRYHLGKMIIESFRRYPDKIHQIDGITGETETNASVLERTIVCANSMKNIGLEEGDVIVLMAPNHVDICIPFYAALYLGVIVSAVDRTLLINELEGTFNVSKPKLIFCQSDKAQDVQVALNEIDLNAQIITFDKGDYLCSFPEFMEKHGGDVNCDEFEPSDFDTEEAIAFLIATSGTTGLPKAAAVTHKNFSINIPYLWHRYKEFPSPTRMTLIGSPLQWLTALVNFLSTPIIGFIRLQISQLLTQELCCELLSKYKPTWTIFSPTLMTSMIKYNDSNNCDLTSLETILLGGSAVPVELIQEIKTISPNSEVFNAYGMSELAGLAFSTDDPPLESCGKPLGCWQYRLIDIDSGDDILEPNTSGELWLKGPGIFKEYYNNPEATEETFAEDRWFRTGDMFYRDQHHNYYFVERIKLLLKYKGFQISPVEIENVVRTHPGVLDVAVTGISDSECGELPVACVVLRPGHDVSADEIKELVKESLTESKLLRGGVIFLTEIPMTASTKIHRRKLKEIVQNMDRE